RPEISVSEGHQIGMQVVSGMRDALDNIRYINFHIDAENDEDQPLTSERLPSREDIRAILARHLGELPHHNRLRLHYLRNKVHLELFLDEPEVNTVFTSGNIRTELKDYPWFGSVRVWVAGP
ncbi:MAG: cation transporter, partial [Marinobacter sp.]|nr:cation transporter [Marinobacter sp.]